MLYSEIIDKVSKELNLSTKVVDNTYKGYWLCIKEHIKSLPLKEDLSEEEFNKLTTSINIPSIGKLYCGYDKYSSMRNYYKKCKKEYND